MLGLMQTLEFAAMSGFVVWRDARTFLSQSRPSWHQEISSSLCQVKWICLWSRLKLCSLCLKLVLEMQEVGDCTLH